MIVECPHCYTSIVPNPAGECPSCRKNVHDLAGADSSKAALSVHCGDQLPPYCCDCGQATDRYVRVASRVPSQGGDSKWLMSLAALLGGLLGIFAFGLGEGAEREGDTLVAQIPQCDRCGALGSPEAIRVNRDEMILTFVVHRDFKEKCAALGEVGP